MSNIFRKREVKGSDNPQGNQGDGKRDYLRRLLQDKAKRAENLRQEIGDRCENLLTEENAHALENYASRVGYSGELAKLLIEKLQQHAANDQQMGDNELKVLERFNENLKKLEASLQSPLEDTATLEPYGVRKEKSFLGRLARTRAKEGQKRPTISEPSDFTHTKGVKVTSDAPYDNTIGISGDRQETVQPSTSEGAPVTSETPKKTAPQEAPKQRKSPEEPQPSTSEGAPVTSDTSKKTAPQEAPRRPKTTISRFSRFKEEDIDPERVAAIRAQQEAEKQAAIRAKQKAALQPPEDPNADVSDLDLDPAEQKAASQPPKDSGSSA